MSFQNRKEPRSYQRDYRTPDVDPNIAHYCIPHQIAEDGRVTCQCRLIDATKRDAEDRKTRWQTLVVS